MEPEPAPAGAWRLALVDVQPPAADADAAGAAAAPLAVRADQAAHARAARAAQAAERKKRKAPAPTEAQLQVCVALLPGAAQLLGVKLDRAAVPHEAIVQLAMAARLKGSGPAVEQSRSLQNQAVALVGHTALKKQTKGLQEWLSRMAALEPPGDIMRGFTMMWDEAAQKTRSIRPLTFSNSVRVVQVQVCLAAIYQVEASAAVEKWQWQPWLCPPLFLADTRHASLLASFEKVLPFQWWDPASMAAFGEGASCTIFCLAFDMASSNVAAFARVVRSLEVAGPSCTRWLVHGERCLVHQLHIIKSACLSMSQAASMLYSISRILPNDTASTALADAIYCHVRLRLVIKYQAAPPKHQDELLRIMRHILNCDGSESMDNHGEPHRHRCSSWLGDVERMCQKCHWDGATSRWVYFAPPDDSGRFPEVNVEEAVKSVADPLVAALIGRRWPKAALSRWSGVLSCLKRMLAGIVMGNILPDSLASLSSSMKITEAKVKKMLDDIAERIRRGEDADNHRAQACARVLKVATYFQGSERSWQLGIIFVGATIMEQLHWKIIGTPSKGHQKLCLSNLVDPGSSEVATVAQKLLGLLQRWSLDQGEWHLLHWLGARKAPQGRLMTVARGAVLQLAASYFIRLEMRFSSWPYRLQHLLSPRTAASQKQETIDRFLAASRCCLGPFGRGFRDQFPTSESLRSETCVRALRLWECQIRFSTHPADCEHHVIHDVVRSLTSGVSMCPAAFRSVCRHLNASHVQKGGANVAVRLRRDPRQLPGTGPCIAWDRPEAGSGPSAIEDARDSSGSQAVVSEEPPFCQDEAMLQPRGGNPKVMYLNYKVSAKRTLLQRAMTAAEVKETRDRAVQEFDESMQLQQRWRQLFDLKTERQRVGRMQ